MYAVAFKDTSLLLLSAVFLQAGFVSSAWRLRQGCEAVSETDGRVHAWSR